VDKWTKVGLVFLLAGMAILAATLPFMGSEVVARDSMRSTSGWRDIYDLDLEAGSYTIWVEDVYPGFDDWGYFDAYAYDEMGNEEWGWYPGTYRTATFDGVECELVVGFDLWTDVWYFEIEHYDDGGIQPPQDIEIFIVRSPPAWMGAVVGVGITLASLGAITVALLKWPKKVKKAD
jgi:hypothetical protein